MSTAEQQKRDESLSALAEMRAQGTIPDEVYFKALVCLAYDCIATGDVQAAISILLLCPLSYFQNTQGQQIVEDHEYALKAQKLADVLVEHGEITDLFTSKNTGRA